MNLLLAYVCIVSWTMTPALMRPDDRFMDPAQNYNCPESDVDFYGCTLYPTREVQDWRDCGELCESQTKPKCLLWTLTDKKHCTLKTCPSVPQHKKDFISGARGCK